METLDKVRKIVSEETGLTLDEVDVDADIQDGLALDDFDRAEILTSLEEEFDIEFPEEAYFSLSTVREIAAMVDLRLREKR